MQISNSSNTNPKLDCHINILATVLANQFNIVVGRGGATLLFIKEKYTSSHVNGTQSTMYVAFVSSNYRTVDCGLQTCSLCCVETYIFVYEADLEVVMLSIS